MKFRLGLSLLAVLLISAASAHAATEGRRCAERVRNAGCDLSNNNFERIDHDVNTCKQLNAQGNKLEVFLLNEAGKVVVVDTTRGRGDRNCPAIKYTIDDSGIDTVKVLANRVFMRSDSGRVYFMQGNQAVYELLNVKKK